jgi:coiled-coil domain-containing protein 12
MSLAEEASKRKERLRKLKQDAEANNTAKLETKRPADGGDSLRFRAYQPESESLQQFKQQEPSVGPKANIDQDTVENRALKIKEEAQAEEQRMAGDLDLENLAPKKRNWDLKRDLAKKLEKLDQLTKIAMADIIRDRLKASGDISLAATAQAELI